MDIAWLLMTSSSGHAVLVVSYQSGCDLPRLSFTSEQANEKNRGSGSALHGSMYMSSLSRESSSSCGNERDDGIVLHREESYVEQKWQSDRRQKHIAAPELYVLEI